MQKAKNRERTVKRGGFSRACGLPTGLWAGLFIGPRALFFLIFPMFHFLLLDWKYSKQMGLFNQNSQKTTSYCPKKGLDFDRWCVWWMTLFPKPVPCVVWESYFLRKWECYSLSCRTVIFLPPTLSCLPIRSLTTSSVFQFIFFNIALPACSWTLLC